MSDETIKKPAFLSRERAESIGYVGADVSPEFDTELEALPELDTDMVPRGAGPSAGYLIRWKEIARLHAHGYTNNQIARHLGYSAIGISSALKRPFIQAEVKKLREIYYSQDTANVIKEGSLDAVRRIHKMILDPNTKDTTALDASKWMAEKGTGKAKQEISVESGTLASFMEVLNNMRNQGETFDVTPQPVAIEVQNDKPVKALNEGSGKEDDWTQWIDQNLK